METQGWSTELETKFFDDFSSLQTSSKRKKSSSKTKVKTSGTNNEATPDDQVDHDRKPKDANLISL